MCHLNLLKPFYARTVTPKVTCSPVAVASVTPTGELGQDVKAPDGIILRPRLKNSETMTNLEGLLKRYLAKQRSELISLITEFSVLFSDVPSCINLIEHDIDVGNAKPVHQRFYRVSLDKRKTLESEINYMLENNIAKTSFSDWASPCLLVGKPDGTQCFCTDYRCDYELRML